MATQNERRLDVMQLVRDGRENGFTDLQIADNVLIYLGLAAAPAPPKEPEDGSYERERADVLAAEVRKLRAAAGETERLVNMAVAAETPASQKRVFKALAPLRGVLARPGQSIDAPPEAGEKKREVSQEAMDWAAEVAPEVNEAIAKHDPSKDRSYAEWKAENGGGG